jgi:peptidoglycan glycosyltransferase
MRAEGIGQGELTVTPLQMARIAATLANDGEMTAPRLVRRIQQPSGHWQDQPAAGVSHTVLSPQLADELLNNWHPYGDCVRGFVGVAVAGESLPPHAWFLGVVLDDTDRYAVVVLVEHAAEPEVAADIGTALLGAAKTIR